MMILRRVKKRRDSNGLVKKSAMLASVRTKGTTSFMSSTHSRMKHVERRHFFIRECVEDMKIVVPFVRTDANLADFFTKPLEPRRFFSLRNLIMNHTPSHS